MAQCAGQGTGGVHRAWQHRVGNGARAGSQGILTVTAITIATIAADFSRSACLLPVITGTTTITTTTIPTTTPTRIVTSAASAFTAIGCADAIASTNTHTNWRAGPRDAARQFVGRG